MKATRATDKSVSAYGQLGEHRVVQETARDETGRLYEYFRCVDCGKEQVDSRAFTDEVIGAHRCNGGDL